MTRAGLEAARKHGEQLPAFRSQEQAEAELFGLRDKLLTELQQLVRQHASFALDFSPDSLKVVERWFFETAENPGFEILGFDHEVVRQAINAYVGEVLVRNGTLWRWSVDRFPFLPNRYELGVCKPLVAIMLVPGSGLVDQRTSGKRMQSLWRFYKKYAG